MEPPRGGGVREPFPRFAHTPLAVAGTSSQWVAILHWIALEKSVHTFQNTADRVRTKNRNEINVSTVSTVSTVQNTTPRTNWQFLRSTASNPCASHKAHQDLPLPQTCTHQDLPLPQTCTHQDLPTARPPVKGTTKQQGRKGNSNRVVSLVHEFLDRLIGCQSDGLWFIHDVR
jgi:hypothetical protein